MVVVGNLSKCVVAFIGMLLSLSGVLVSIVVHGGALMCVLAGWYLS